MEDNPVTGQLLRAEQAWSGSHAALAARLARPDAVRLTEEQEALALGVTRRLVLDLARSLPLLTEAEALWSVWESGGMPSARLIAPAVMARVEEFRWRRAPLAPAPDALPPLFASAPGDAAPVIVDEVEMAKADEEKQHVDGPGLEDVYLALRIADGLRCDAFDRPVLMPAELGPDVLRALLLDIAAQDLAGDDSPADRAGPLATTIDALVAQWSDADIDRTAAAFLAVLDADELRADACASALARGDWLAVIAVVAAGSGLGFSRAAAAMSGASDQALAEIFGALGVPVASLPPLLDVMAALPGRAPLATSPDQIGSQAAALAARAEMLRGGTP